MKIRSLMALPLAATMMLPAMAQQSNTPDQSNQATQSQPADQNQDQISNRQPLQNNTREGFWGHLNPFARKKYVQRQMAPIRNRVNELDDLTAANSKNIKDVDARAQEGIRQSMAKANEADQHALAAGNTAQQANQTAQQASTRLQTVESVVTNYDQYAPSNQTEIRFRSGQTLLSKRAKDALDQIANSLQGQKNYIIEVQGFAPGSSAAAVANSQRMADSVVRYLVLSHEIPVYRVYTLGMGNARVQAASQEQNGEAKSARPYRGPRVDITVLKNTSVDQLSQQAMNTPQQGALPQAQGISSPASTNTGMNNNSQPVQQQPSPNSQPQQ
jgi:outer membrane protein OmpA-like peptidoglycan-associated protein